MKKLLVVLFAFAFPFLTACTVLETVEDNPLAAQLVVQQSTLRVIDEDPDKAQRVAAVVEEVRIYVEDEFATLGLIEQAVRAQIEWDRLTLADQILIDAVLSEARTELERRFGAGLLDPNSRASVMTVLDWVEQSARLVVLHRG